MIDGIVRVPLKRYEDERGWLMELRRESALPKPTRQTNVSFSRAGVIRGLHYHERGQDDLFCCLAGHGPRRRPRPRAPARRSPRTSATTTRWRSTSPAIHAHGFEALTDLVFCYHVTEEYDPADPDEHGIAWDDPRVVHLWSTASPILSARDTPAS